MKSRLYFLSLAIIAACFYSCESSSNLASKMQGMWSGGVVGIEDHSVFTTSYVPVFSFDKQQDRNGGTFTLNAMVESSGIVNSKAVEIVAPISLSVSANATITGRWRATDSDKVLLQMDIKSMQINVDPDAIALNHNIISNESAPVADSIAPNVAAAVKAHVESVMRGEFATMTEIDDIKIDKGLMKCEINDKDIILSRDE